jgi:ABC-2 type transport system ATP-binding protein
MIARAMVHQPKLLILDEPTAGVDIEIRRSMWELMQTLNREGTTIILTTHYLEEAESLCRNIAIINDGGIRERSSMQTLLSKIQTEYFVLDLATAVTVLPQVEGYRIELLDAKTLQVAVDKTQGLNRLFQSLAEQGLTVLSMKNKSNRLEQLFLDMVK